jgi:hypothetical protein
MWHNLEWACENVQNKFQRKQNRSRTEEDYEMECNILNKFYSQFQEKLQISYSVIILKTIQDDQ